MKRMTRDLGRMLLITCLALAPSAAVAGPIAFSFSNGTRAASAEFERSGSNLIVTLSNLSTADALVPTDILTGIFFELSGDPALTRVSAVVPATSSVMVGGTGVDVTPADRVVGGEWAYQHGLTQLLPYNAGISSTGLGIFGPPHLFPGPNLQGPTSPGGLEYGITSAGDDLLTGNGGLAGRNLTKNSVVFTLGGFDGEPDALIRGVAFQYGTALDEPRFTAHTPEPSSWVLLALAMAAMFGYARRRV